MMIKKVTSALIFQLCFLAGGVFCFFELDSEISLLINNHIAVTFGYIIGYKYSTNDNN